MQWLSYKSKQFLFGTIKLLIVLGAIYFIASRLQYIDFPSTKKLLIESLSYLNIAILLIFSILNWYLEIFKWKTLVSPIKKLSFKKATTQVLASHTTALLTPAKLGEYGAKALHFNPKHRKTILLLNLKGNMAQLLATVIFGLVGLAILTAIFWREYFLWFWITTLASVSVAFLLRRLQILSTITTNYEVLGLAFLRYIIFAHQFYFLILLFGIEVSYMNALSLIAVMYLGSSMLPVLQFMDVIVKGGVAVALFSLVAAPEASILSITLVMWIFNTVLPAIIGSYYVIRFKPIVSKPQIA